MINPQGPVKVLLAVKPVGFREGTVGLASLDEHELQRDPFSRILFVFRCAGLTASPIIVVQPQSAILGLGKLEKWVVVGEVGGADTLQIRPLCFVSLTIDHHDVDGHQTNL